MTLKFIKEVTKEGKRKVINVPKKLYNEVEVGDSILCSKLDLQKIGNENDTSAV